MASKKAPAKKTKVVRTKRKNLGPQIRKAASELDKCRKLLRGLRTHGVASAELEAAIVAVNRADVAIGALETKSARY
ncbi:MAG: hypothetical protein P8Y27_04935 [Chromatiaceae bacterium]